MSQDIVWISNDSLGGFTINGRGFPATAPIVANLGDRILIRFMNEGVMMHPWHLHGMPMRIVARDGYDLGAAAFTCDTLGVNPGERWDAVIDATSPVRGPSTATSCRTRRVATGCSAWSRRWSSRIPSTALAASPSSASPAVAAAAAAGSTALICQIM